MTAPADPGPAPETALRSTERHAVVTRDEDSGTGRLGRALRALGVPVLHWRTTAVGPPDDPSELHALAATAAGYDWIVFTSRRAVEAVASVVGARPLSLSVAVVGGKTAEVAEAAGWAPEVVGGGTGEELARELAARLGDGPARLLYPTTPLAADRLPAVLSEAGHEVRRVDAYRTYHPALEVDACREVIEAGAVGVVTFTSPSAVDGLARGLPEALLERLLQGSRAVTIGPTTGEAARRAGWRASEVEEPSLDGVARRAAALLGEAG